MRHEYSATTIGCCARQILSILKIRNVDPLSLIHQSELIQYKQVKSAGRILAVDEAELLEAAATAFCDPIFGLTLGARADPRDAGLVFYLSNAAATLKEAITLFANYISIINNSVSLQITPAARERRSVIIHYDNFPRHKLTQMIEYHFAFFIRFLREVGGQNISPSRLAFSHSRDLGLGEFERFFCCPVHFASDADAIEFESETLNLPTSSGDPLLLQILRDFAQDFMASRGLPSIHLELRGPRSEMAASPSGSE